MAAANAFFNRELEAHNWARSLLLVVAFGIMTAVLYLVGVGVLMRGDEPDAAAGGVKAREDEL